MSIPTKCTVHSTPSTAFDRTLNFRLYRGTFSAFDYARRWLESWSCSQVDPAAMLQVSVSGQRPRAAEEEEEERRSKSAVTSRRRRHRHVNVSAGAGKLLPSFCHRRCLCQRFVLVCDLMLLADALSGVG